MFFYSNYGVKILILYVFKTHFLGSLVSFKAEKK